MKQLWLFIIFIFFYVLWFFVKVKEYEIDDRNFGCYFSPFGKQND